MNKSLKVFTLSAMVAVIQACATVGPDYVQPELEPVVEVSAQLDTMTERSTQWWQHFGDATIDQIVELAFANNLSLKMAQANVERSLAVFDDIDNDHLPTGSVGAEYRAQDQITPGFSNTRTNTRSYELGASLNWSLDLFGKIERSRQFAQANAEAEWLALQALQVDIVAQAVQAYGDLKGLKARIDLVKKNADIVAQTLSIVQARFEEGFASELDLKRIEAQHFSVLSELPRLQADYQRTRNFLETILGSREALAFLDYDSLSAQALELDKPFAIGDASQFLKYRPDVHTAERRLAAASAQIGVNTADLYPDVSVGGFIGYLSGDLSDLGSGTEAWRVAPSLSWQILDYGSIQARIRAATADERKAFLNFEETVLNAIKEADNSLNTYASVRERHALLTEQLSASRVAYSLARELYESGEVGLLDLLDAERQVLSVEDENVVSNIQTFTAIVEVYSAFGGGASTQNELDFESDRLAAVVR